MNDLKFKCYHCSQHSAFEVTSENRDEVKRFTGEGDKKGTVKFICLNCGMANDIEIDLKTAMSILGRLSSDDPHVQDAITQAKSGDYGAALNLAKKKFGF